MTFAWAEHADGRRRLNAFFLGFRAAAESDQKKALPSAWPEFRRGWKVYRRCQKILKRAGLDNVKIRIERGPL